MASIPESDFSNLFDLDLDLNNYYPQDANPKLGEGPNIAHADQQQLSHDIAIQQQQHHMTPIMSQPTEQIPQNNVMFDFSMPMDVQFSVPAGPQPIAAHNMIPPTPNSAELHSDTVRYLQLEAQRMMMQQYQMGKNDAVC